MQGSCECVKFIKVDDVRFPEPGKSWKLRKAVELLICCSEGLENCEVRTYY